MTPAKRNNLKRLLNPRHIAVIGGNDAEIALKACQRIGYTGPIWPVNPKREVMAGLKCYQSIDQLPAAPDAVFLAVPAKAAIGSVKQLSRMGAGGVVCYTAGFSDDGSQGSEADQPLMDVVGDIALVGPNCYGLINYINNVSLWPFAHGGYCPGYGAAIITQSGMLSSDITMNQRSVPLAYMISAGNQSDLQLHDYLDLLADRDEVRCFGLHIEGLKDINAFSQVAYKVLELNKPIVVLKTGTSKIGSKLTISHTGSLSGTNELYQALFDRLGIITVTNPSQMLETLKFVSVAGIPAGNRIMGFTCSGGGATMLADYAEKIELEFPQPSKEVAGRLIEKLPVIADVTNPLDYTTPIWGQTEKVQPVFETALEDGYDAAVIVQDYPLDEVNESKRFYINDAKAFMAATRLASIPAAVCSTLPENIDQQTRELVIAHNVAPLQGIHDALDAINRAVSYGVQRQFCLGRKNIDLINFNEKSTSIQVDEWQCKNDLKQAGFNVPENLLVTAQTAADAARQIGFPVALKMNSPKIAHKTEVGAVSIGLNNISEVEQALLDMQARVSSVDNGLLTDAYIVERMLEQPVAELMLSIRHDKLFGLAMTLSSGGTWVEVLQDAKTLLLPVTKAQIANALKQLKVAQMLNGFRGRPGANLDQLVETIMKLAHYVESNTTKIAELEINPLFVYPDEVFIVDGLMQIYQ